MGNLNVTLAQANQVFDGGVQHAVAHAAMAGFVPATFDTRFSPKKPLTGTWAGVAFTFTWNAGGTVNTSTMNGVLKTAVYDTDGTLLSFS